MKSIKPIKLDFKAKMKLSYLIKQDLATEGFEINFRDDYLNDGSYGIVFKCVRNKELFACKIVPNCSPFDHFSVRDWDLAKTYSLQEKKILETIGSHLNVIKLQDFIFKEHEFELDSGSLQFKCMYFVMDFADCGDLEELICKGVLNENTVKILANDLVNGVEYLHSQNVFHLDIKPENCLLGTREDQSVCKYILKLADFNLATSKVVSVNVVGTPSTMCPEFLQNSYAIMTKQSKLCLEVSTNRADAFSVGATLFFSLVGTFPLINQDYYDNKEDFLKKLFFNGRNELELNSEIYFDVVRSYIKPISTLVSSECRTFITGLLEVNPEKRTKIEQGIMDAWMKAESPIMETVGEVTK